MPYKDRARQRKFQREWLAKRRSDYFEGKTCAEPGCNAIHGLQLHHKYPEQKMTHRIWSFSEKRRKEELAKCEPRCEKHHREWHKKHGGDFYEEPPPPYL